MLLGDISRPDIRLGHLTSLNLGLGVVPAFDLESIKVFDLPEWILVVATPYCRNISRSQVLDHIRREIIFPRVEPDVGQVSFLSVGEVEEDLSLGVKLVQGSL